MDYWEPLSFDELKRILNRIRERKPSWEMKKDHHIDGVEIEGNMPEGIHIRLYRSPDHWRLSLDTAGQAKICATEYENRAVDEHRLLDTFIEEVRSEVLRLRQLKKDAQARENQAARQRFLG